MDSFEYIRKRHGNKEWGGRIIYHNYTLCFQPLTFEKADDGRWYYSDHIEEQELKIVARGIVPHYIRYEHEKNLKELFADYYNGCFEAFKNNRRNDIELMLKSEKEIEIAFVETMIDEERERIDFSKKGLKQYAEYFTDKENEILKQVGNGFISYLQNRLKELKPTIIDEVSNSVAFIPLSDDLNKYLHGMQNSMYDEQIINEMQYNDFVSCIYQANFKTMFDTAKENRNLKRLYLIIGRIKTWFSSDWEQQAASSMGITVDTMRKITPSEIKRAHPKWYKDLDNTIPKYNPMQ